MAHNPHSLSTEPSTIVELLRRRAPAQPEQLAYFFLTNGETEDARLTYEGLDHQARAVAALLQSHVPRGERCLLLYGSGPDFVTAFLGCLYSGVIAIPVYPPRLNRNLLRIRSIVADAHATIALTVSPIFDRLEPLFSEVPDLKRLRWLTTDNLALGLAECWREPSITGDDLSFLQYTSGSTATPRGVMVSHENLLSNVALTWKKLQGVPEDCLVTWLPLYHDMGLIGGILLSLYGAVPCVLMAPTAFLQRPIRWLEAITRYKGTISPAPNFAYDLCVRKIKPELRNTLDLSSWRVAINGAEPVRSRTLDSFTAAFASCGFSQKTFYSCYGLAEATLTVTGGNRDDLPVFYKVCEKGLEQNRAIEAQPDDHDLEIQTLVGCGQTLPGQRVVIMNPESRTECAADQVGEIWVSGPSVARGYWNKPEETAYTFNASVADTREGPFLRTGDLGFLKEGELFVTGRLKDLIIIDGRNHYPQDIELTVEQSHPALRPGGSAAFSIEIDGHEQLIVAAEVERQYWSKHRQSRESGPENPLQSNVEVFKAIRRAVAEEHEVRVYEISLLKPGSIPKTSSGKIQRHACRAGFQAGTLAALEPATVSAPSRRV